MTTTLMTKFGLPKMARFPFDVGELKKTCIRSQWDQKPYKITS